MRIFLNAIFVFFFVVFQFPANAQNLSDVAIAFDDATLKRLKSLASNVGKTGIDPELYTEAEIREFKGNILLAAPRETFFVEGTLKRNIPDCLSVSTKFLCNEWLFMTPQEGGVLFKTIPINPWQEFGGYSSGYFVSCNASIDIKNDKTSLNFSYAVSAINRMLLNKLPNPRTLSSDKLKRPWGTEFIVTKETAIKIRDSIRLRLVFEVPISPFTYSDYTFMITKYRSISAFPKEMIIYIGATGEVLWERTFPVVPSLEECVSPMIYLE